MNCRIDEAFREGGPDLWVVRSFKEGEMAGADSDMLLVNCVCGSCCCGCAWSVQV